MEHIWIKEEREDTKEDVDLSNVSLPACKVFLHQSFIIMLYQNAVCVAF
jgi:hypothetical protein